MWRTVHLAGAAKPVVFNVLDNDCVDLVLETGLGEKKEWRVVARRGFVVVVDNDWLAIVDSDRVASPIRALPPPELDGRPGKERQSNSASKLRARSYNPRCSCAKRLATRIREI